MKYLEQKPGLFWWTKNIRYFMYFARELSGIIIGFTAFILILTLTAGILFFKNANLKTFVLVLAWTALVSAVIHTLTWLGALPKILPLQITAFQQRVVWLFLIIVWIGMSYFLMCTLYQQ